MALDLSTLDLLPRAADLLAGIGERDGLKLELPASQIEIVTPHRDDVGELIGDLRRARLRLADALEGRAALACAGAHPFAAAEGELNRGGRYERLRREYGIVARRQLVCGLHVHIGVSGADRALAVYNALRTHLPELAALAANAPFHEGRDTGLASVRPLICGMLPRQGVPPAYRSWEELASDLSWGAKAGRVEGMSGWWWELRLHAQLGTVEVRAPDAQSSVKDVAAVVTTICALALRLAQLYDDAPEQAGPSGAAAVSGWRIAENRWSAARDGVDGEMIDFETAEAVPTRARLHALLRSLRPQAARIGAAQHLDAAHELAERNGAARQRAVFAEGGREGLMRHLVESFAS